MRKDIVILNLVFGGLLFSLLALPFVYGAMQARVVADALNRECATHYSFYEVLVAGDSLSRICQAKKGQQP